MPLLLGDGKVGDEALEIIRERGGTWAAYQNHDLGHRDIGHLRFLKYGEDCTFKVPPSRYPDTKHAIGWRYLFVGLLNLETGKAEVA